MTVIVLALLVLLGVSSSGGSSETSVQLAAVESENAELRRRLDAPSGTETVTERVTEQVTQVQEQEAVPAPAAPLAPAGGCSPAYSGACVPTGVGDVNCPDVAAQGFLSVGSDPYDLDRENDGIACES